MSSLWLHLTHLSPAENPPQRRNAGRFSHQNHGNGCCVCIRNETATLTPLRNAISSATPNSMILFECCGVADKTAISRGSPRRGEFDFAKDGSAILFPSKVKNFSSELLHKTHGFC